MPPLQDVGAMVAMGAAFFFVLCAVRPNANPMRRATIYMARGGRTGDIAAAGVFLVAALVGFLAR
jgi:hypothetical protein